MSSSVSRKKAYQSMTFVTRPTEAPDSIGLMWTKTPLIGPSRSTRRDYHPLAERQFGADLEALKAADTCVLVLPCGRSTHTEAGWMAGAGKRVIVYIPEMVEPELMYKLFDQVVDNLDNLVQCLCYDGEIKEG